MSFANKFGSLKSQVEDATEAPVVQPKKQEKNFGHGKEKKVVVKAKTVPAAESAKAMDEGGFSLGNQPAERGNRGGRGGRGGDRPRTARGGRGDRPRTGGDQEGGERPQTAGRGRGRGDRGGRGRGGNRPRYDRTTQQVEGGEGQGPAHHNRGDRQVHGFQGKPREEYHPMDRESGTGVGKKDQRKGGNRPGGNRQDKHDNFPTEKVAEAKAEAEEETKQEETAEAAATEETKQEEAKPEPEEEDEEALPGIDFADWEAKRQAERQTGVLAVKQAREHVANPKDRVIENTEVKQRTQVLGTTVTGRESHAIRAGTGADLLGFAGAPEEEEYERRDRGGRGGRGGAASGRGRGGNRQQQQNNRQGGRKGGRIVGNELDFPSL